LQAELSQERHDVGFEALAESMKLRYYKRSVVISVSRIDSAKVGIDPVRAASWDKKNISLLPAAGFIFGKDLIL